MLVSKPSRAALVACLALLTAPSAGLRRKSKKNAAADSWKEHYKQFGDRLAATENPNGYNYEKCESYVREPAGESRGLIVLQHGFTACSGFWYLMTPALVADGWTVMAPTMVGHGRLPQVEPAANDTYVVREYLADLPNEWEAYQDYAFELMEISEKYRAANPSKEMVLVGCSHGAAIVAWMAMNGVAGTWDRLMFLNPFLAPPTALGADYGLSFTNDIIAEVLPAFEPLMEDGVSWGATCETRKWPGDPRDGGHGGICQFSVTNFAAVLQFGNEVEGEMRSRAATLGVFSGGLFDQMVGHVKYATTQIWQSITGGAAAAPSPLVVQTLTTAFDASISNARVHFMVEALQERVESSSFCVFPREFTHTYINPIDKEPGSLLADPWWLDPSRIVGGKTVVDRMNDFISARVFYPTDGVEMEDSALIGDPRCDVKEM